MSYDTDLRNFNNYNSNPTTTVSVKASGGDYTSVKDALAGISGLPSVSTPYRIYVYNGTYNEIQMDGQAYVTIEGESRTGVTIISDGLRTDVDPVSGQRYVDMLVDTKHGFKAMHNLFTLKNLTLQVNDVKYCVHADQSNVCYMYFDNCHFKHADGFPIGCGCRQDQRLTFTDCIFEKTGANVAWGIVGAAGIFWHNWNEQAGGTWLKLIDCSFVNCGMLSLAEFGSDYEDLLWVENCETDDETKGIRLVVDNNYWHGGGQDKDTLPYSIQILTIGGTFPLPISYVEADRPDIADNISVE